jgi:hypothetical protein
MFAVKNYCFIDPQALTSKGVSYNITEVLKEAAKIITSIAGRSLNKLIC